MEVPGRFFVVVWNRVSVSNRHAHQDNYCAQPYNDNEKDPQQVFTERRTARNRLKTTARPTASTCRNVPHEQIVRRVKTPSDCPQKQHASCQRPWFACASYQSENFLVETRIPQVKQIEHIRHGQAKNYGTQQSDNSSTSADGM
jgi:hypothetical protein